VDLSLIASLELAGGVLAAIDCSFEQPYRCHYELVGTKGIIDVPDAYLPPASAKPLARWRRIGMACDTGPKADHTEILEFDAANQYAAMVDAFAESVRMGELVGLAENGLAQMQVLDQIKTAARDGRCI
jgi:predicted dehydrogenase